MSEGDPDLFRPYNADVLVYHHVGPFWNVRITFGDIKLNGSAIQQGGITLGVEVDRMGLVSTHAGKVECPRGFNGSRVIDVQESCELRSIVRHSSAIGCTSALP